MFAAYFGDDEGTAAEGPYLRLLRLRKWLIIASGLASLNAAGHIQPKAISKLIGGAAILEPATITTVIVGSLFLLTIQYGLLLAQGSTVYDLTLADRMAGKRRDEISEQQKALEKARDEARQAEDRLTTAHDELGRAVLARPAEARQVEEHLNSPDIVDRIAFIEENFRDRFPAVYDFVNGFPQDTRREALIFLDILSRKNPNDFSAWMKTIGTERAVSIATPLSNANHKVSPLASRFVDAKRDFEIASEAAKREDLELQRVAKSDPASRPTFMRIEQVLDRIRTWPPMLISGLAWLHIVYAIGWSLAHRTS